MQFKIKTAYDYYKLAEDLVSEIPRLELKT
jgi:hypothetical protein